MKTSIVLVGALGAIILALLPAQIPAVSLASPVVAFVGANVVPMDRERIITNQTVVVRNGRIESITPAGSTKLPADALRIDSRGKYLMPGLVDMHAHIPAQDRPQQYIEDVLFLRVANGITTVRGLFEGVREDQIEAKGATAMVQLRDRISRGEIVGSTMYVAGPQFNGLDVKTPEAAIARVHEQKAAGVDFLKVLSGLTLPTYDALVRTAHQEGMRFSGHVPEDVGLLHAIDSGQEIIDHLDGYLEYLGAVSTPMDTTKMKEVVRLTREKNVWVVPTMALWEANRGLYDLEILKGYPELKYMPPEIVQDWTTFMHDRMTKPDFSRANIRQMITNRMILLKAMHEAGVHIMMGTDSPTRFSVPGFAIQRELDRYVVAGITPFETLRAATRTAGEYFKDKDAFGTVEVGKRADLLLVNGNPLENVTNVSRRSGVMLRGKWIPESDIQAGLAKIATRYAARK